MDFGERLELGQVRRTDWALFLGKEEPAQLSVTPVSLIQKPLMVIIEMSTPTARL